MFPFLHHLPAQRVNRSGLKVVGLCHKSLGRSMHFDTSARAVRRYSQAPASLLLQNCIFLNVMLQLFLTVHTESQIFMPLPRQRCVRGLSHFWTTTPHFDDTAISFLGRHQHLKSSIAKFGRTIPTMENY